MLHPQAFNVLDAQNYRWPEDLIVYKTEMPEDKGVHTLAIVSAILHCAIRQVRQKSSKQLTKEHEKGLTLSMSKTN